MARKQEQRKELRVAVEVEAEAGNSGCNVAGYSYERLPGQGRNELS